MLTNHKEKWVSIDGLAEPVLVPPGSFITGRNAFHKVMFPKYRKKNPSPLTVWRWLQTLQTLGNLEIKSNKRFSLVSIVNWGVYQQKENQIEQANEQPVNKQRTTGEQPVNTNKNVKNVKNVKKTNNSMRKWPSDFCLTDEMKLYATDKGIDPIKLDSFFCDFKDWAESKGAKYKDWTAAFRTRVNKAPDYGKQFMKQTDPWENI